MMIDQKLTIMLPVQFHQVDQSGLITIAVVRTLLLLSRIALMRRVALAYQLHLAQQSLREYCIFRFQVLLPSLSQQHRAYYVRVVIWLWTETTYRRNVSD